MGQGEPISNVMSVIEDENPKTWRLVFTGAGEEGSEEGVFKIRGILKEKDLPPIKQARRYVFWSV